MPGKGESIGNGNSMNNGNSFSNGPGVWRNWQLPRGSSRWDFTEPPPPQ